LSKNTVEIRTHEKAIIHLRTTHRKTARKAAKDGVKDFISSCHIDMPAGRFFMFLFAARRCAYRHI